MLCFKIFHKKGLLFSLLFFLFSINSFLISQNNELNSFIDEYQRVDSIQIIGNETTKDFVILRELTFGVGDSVNNEILFFNRERIFSLGIFTKVDLSFIQSNEVNVLQILIEESWYIFPVPFINIREKTLKRTSYGISLKYKNFRGRNETIRATVSLGYDPFYSLEYENPLIIPSHDISFAFACAYGSPINKSLILEEANGESFDFDVLSVNTMWGKRLNTESNLFFTLGYSSIKTPSNNVIPFMASQTSVDNAITLGIAYVYDTRNLKQFADKGIYFASNYLQSGFGIDNIDYNELSVDISKYKQIFNSLVLKGRMHSKHVFGKYIPPYKLARFGYDYYTRGNRYLVTEGKNRILGSVELAFPILTEWNFAIDVPLIPNSLTRARIAVHTSIFGDVGKVFNNATDLKLNNLNSGFGAGITFLFLPYNSFRIEYAFNEKGRGELLLETGISF